MNGKMTIMACITGFLLDCMFGDPVWMYHPIRVIGNPDQCVGKRALRKLLCSQIPASEQEKKNRREVLAGGILWILTVSLSFLVPAVLLFAAGKVHPAVRFLLETFWCYQIFAARCLVGESKNGLSEIKRRRLAWCKKSCIHDCRKRHREPYSRRCDESCSRDSGGEYFRRCDGSTFISSDRRRTAWILIQGSEYDGFHAWIQNENICISEEFRQRWMMYLITFQPG